MPFISAGFAASCSPLPTGRKRTRRDTSSIRQSIRLWKHPLLKNWNRSLALSAINHSRRWSKIFRNEKIPIQNWLIDYWFVNLAAGIGPVSAAAHPHPRGQEMGVPSVSQVVHHQRVPAQTLSSSHRLSSTLKKISISIFTYRLAKK